MTESFEDAMKAMYGEEPRTRPPLPDGFLKTDAEMEKVCGKEFAGGTSRNAHDVIGNPDAVIKKMKLKSPAANFSEQLIWSSLQGTDMEKEFGQILGISESGRYLMMERLSDLTEEEYKLVKYPPDWLKDVKISAYGKNSKGEIKLRDYGMFDIGPALATAKKKAAQWQIEARRTSEKPPKGQG
jgi:hypothetical protein